VRQDVTAASGASVGEIREGILDTREAKSSFFPSPTHSHLRYLQWALLNPPPESDLSAKVFFSFLSSLLLNSASSEECEWGGFVATEDDVLEAN